MCSSYDQISAMPKSSSEQQIAEISIYTLPILKCYHYIYIYTLPILKCYHYISLFLATTTIYHRIYKMLQYLYKI